MPQSKPCSNRVTAKSPFQTKTQTISLAIPSKLQIYHARYWVIHLVAASAWYRKICFDVNEGKDGLMSRISNLGGNDETTLFCEPPCDLGGSVPRGNTR
jgi:hypothetical protein